MKKSTMTLKKNHSKKVEKAVVTHLFMNDKKIKEMVKLKITGDLKVIYLQDNCLTKISNLDAAVNVTHLYLQHNDLTKIENLQSLRNLVKLYLGFNKISVIEGLEQLSCLVELHIECQRLQRGESICLEPRTKNKLSENLQYLNISGNNLLVLKDLRGFCKLKTLIAKNNAIEDPEDVAETVNSLTSLVELSLQGNPVTKSYRYRENIIANSHQLRDFDDKFVSDISREFIKKFRRQKELHFASKRSQTSLSDDITSSLNLPLSFRLSISRAIRGQPEPDLSISFKSTSVELHPHYLAHSKSMPAVINGQENRRLAKIACSKSYQNAKEKIAA